MRLSYASDVVPLDRRVCVHAARAPLGDVLAGLLGGFRAEARVVGSQVVLAPAAPGDTLAPMLRRVNVLEGIVVTGSPAGAPRRSLTVAMDAVSGRSLSRRGATTIAQVLNGAAPGVWAWTSSPSSLLAQYGSVRGASSFGATYPKVYVDGVEAANPLVATEIDADAVERVEVIRGPQGAALYGSDAISGVVNIVTRLGRRRRAARVLASTSLTVALSATWRPSGVMRATMPRRSA
ncbi:MAG: TonB-dependent receptor plug domain-containing protein [Gemmatimonadetes bacterium]|nr:TonB-dependent receptor plug domain-containing protein [Gemmatimonadota bacterium]